MRRCGGLLLAVLLGTGCAGEGSYALNLVFPDREAEQLVTEVSVWALDPGGRSCTQLQDGSVEPGSMLVHSQVTFEYPPDGEVGLSRVPAGRVLFFAEGRAGTGVVVNGCTSEWVKAGGENSVTVRLGWVCRPDPAGEIPQNGIDDDCDQKTDECGSEADCDDQNVCTQDLCVGESCQNPGFPDGLSCNDGQYCTEGDSCSSGACSGTARDCDDDDPCTQDECNEDTDACDNTLQPQPGLEGPSGDASCSNGTDDDCDGLTDLDDPNCISCSQASECDDQNDCTDDDCVASQCENTARTDGIDCDDQDPCSAQDTCGGGVCRSGPTDLDGDLDGYFDAACTGGDDCDDGDVDVHPNAAEGPLGDATCLDGADNDCDGQTDADDPGCEVTAPTCSGLLGGAHFGTRVNGTTGFLEYDGSTLWEIKDGGTAPDWMDTTDLAGLWHLNGSGEIDAYLWEPDSSGNARDAQARNTDGSGVAAAHIPAQLDTGVRLYRSVGGYFIVNSNITVEPWEELSFSAWFRAEFAEGYQPIIYKHGSCKGWLLAIDSGGSVHASLDTSIGECPESVDYSVRTTGYDYRDRSWHHALGVIDRPNEIMRLFVDGQLIGEEPVDNVDSASDGAYVRFGGNWDNSEGFEGSLDEVALWKRALSDHEAQTLYVRQLAAHGGVYESQLCDAGAFGPWARLEPRPQAPYLKPLPPASEADYPGGNAAMGSLVAMWHLDGPAGPLGTSVGAVEDGSGHGFDGTCRDADQSMIVHPGMLNQAVYFEGTGDDRVQIPDADAMDLGGAWTVAAWISPDYIGPERRILDHDGESAAGWAFGMDDSPSNSLYVLVNDTKRSSQADQIEEMRWQHVAVAVGANGAGAFYVDGASAGTFAGLPAPLPAASEVRIGQDPTNSRGFEGSIDEVALWARQLSPQEISAVYTRGRYRALYQVRTCAADPCGAEEYLGPDGTGATWFSEQDNPLPELPVFSLGGMPSNRYLQVRAILGVDDLWLVPPAVSGFDVFAGP